MNKAPAPLLLPGPRHPASVPRFGWCEMVRWMVNASPGEWDERTKQRSATIVDNLTEVEKRYHPDGFMLLECQLLDSSKAGLRWCLPFGPRNTHKVPCEHPFSIDGTASGTVCLAGVYWSSYCS